jgi:hypothetical protein
MPDEDGSPPTQPSTLCAVTVNRPHASTGSVRGFEGVREAVLRVALEGEAGGDRAAHERHFARLEDTVAWSDHGASDGQPSWHW